MKTKFSLDDLVLFMKIAHSQTLGTAARKHNIYHTTLLRKIKQLEEDLGSDLIDHSLKHRIALTDFGQRVFNYLNNDMDNLFNSIDKLAECQNKVDGEINIILPQLFATQFVHPYLAQFVNKYPNLRLNLSYPIVDISVFDTTAYDFAITSIRPSNLNLIIKVFHRSEIALYAAPSYLADHPLPIFEPADLIHHSAIIPRINMQFLYTWQLINQQTQQIETVMLESQCSISTNNFFANLSLAKAGVGICPLIDYIAQPALASGELIRVLSNYTFQEGDECYLVRPNNLKNYRAELFLKFLTSCIDHPPKQ